MKVITEIYKIIESKNNWNKNFLWNIIKTQKLYLLILRMMEASYGRHSMLRPILGVCVLWLLRSLA